MNLQDQIKEYISSQPEPKRSDMQALHRTILQVMPACKLWFLDGKNSEGKTVSNPNIGYGFYTIKYADARPPVPVRTGMTGSDGEKPGSFIKLVSVQTKPESLYISLV